jgi:tetratricopeptide (TPR) repeat protein
LVGKLSSLAPQRRRFWLALLIGAILSAAAAPFFWAGYHAYAAKQAWNRYHSAEALEHFHACFHIWPWSRSSRLHLLAAQAARRQGDFDEARRLLDECQNTLHDDSPEAVVEWALLRAAMGDLDATASELRNAARQDLKLLPLVLEALAEGYLIMSRILDALRTTDAWLELEPNNPQAWFVRGKIHRQVGAVQAIAADYQRVLELDPQRTEARWWLAQALIAIGRYNEAYRELEIYGRSHAHDVDVQVHRAICLRLMGRTEEARSLLDGVLAEHPQHGLALLTRGQLLMSQEHYAEAEPWLRQAVGVLPYDLKGHNALWECLRQQGKTEEAETQRERTDALRDLTNQRSDILTRLMQQRPDDPALHCKLGTLYLQLGSPQVGEAWLLSALRLDAHYKPALEALAKYYQHRGDSERAEGYRRQARSAVK